MLKTTTESYGMTSKETIYALLAYQRKKEKERKKAFSRP